MSKLHDDLLRGRNMYFMVQFDMPTPRAHFILLQQTNTQPVVSDYRQLSRVQKEAMFQATQAMVTDYRLTKEAVTFSLHRGSWYNSHNFHAHLCTDVNEYLQIFRSVSAQTPNWPSQRDVTGQWKSSRNPSDYGRNVRSYPIKNYFKQECEEIQRALQRSADDGGSGWTDVLGPGKMDRKFVPHSSKQWMGVINTTGSPIDYLDDMEGIAVALALSGPHVQNGCHLCYFMDEAMGRREFPHGQAVPAGYINMTPLTFMKILLPSQRQLWLQNFMASTDHNVMT